MVDVMTELWVACHDEIYTDLDGIFVATARDRELAEKIVREHNSSLEKK